MSEDAKVAVVRPQATLRGHVEIARIDHWVKNVFVLPGIVVALTLYPVSTPNLVSNILLGMLSVCLLASSNYVLNAIMDGPYDRWHRLKSSRPVPSGRVSISLAYVQWLALMVIAVRLGMMVSTAFALTMVALWIMACIYNVPPFRTKDYRYLDVLSESINNPIRLLAGWLMVTGSAIPPASLLLSYWMVGSYFMTLKRFSEFREIGNREQAALYRKSFAYYNEENMLISVMFYASAAMLFLGAFVIRYRLELLLSFPIIAFVMATYMRMAFKPNSSAQRPETLYRERLLMGSILLCATVIIFALVVDLPLLRAIFAPTIPTMSESPLK